MLKSIMRLLCGLLSHGIEIGLRLRCRERRGVNAVKQVSQKITQGEHNREDLLYQIKITASILERNALMLGSL